jgi:hypothetical protein
LDAEISFVENRSLNAITVDPPTAALEALIGLRVSTGFRKALDEALPDEDRIPSLRYQLLDELPTAVLVSGFAIAAGGVHPPRGHFNMRQNADICAGWATGATILAEGEEIGYPPTVTGPLAPGLVAPDDSQGWHQLGSTDPHDMRRWRQIDVWGTEPGGILTVEAFFRDSHVDGDGLETVVHEYLVSAELEPRSHVFLSCRADVGVLPWVECPAAAASATRVEGTTPADLRQRIRDTFVGTSTCTHLNDTLRALAVLPFLAGLVEAGGPPARSERNVRRGN